MNRWRLYLKTPDYGHIAAENPTIKHWLANTRFTAPGANDGDPLPRGRLLYNRNVPLAKWPQRGDHVLIFEMAPPPDAEFLQNALSMNDDFPRLFKINGDGQANAIHTNCLWPGESYVLAVREGSELPDLPEGKVISVDCPEISAIRFTVPQTVDARHLNMLRSLRFEVADNARVRPVGILPIYWSDDGQGEWREGEPVMLGIRTARPFRKISICVGNEKQFEIREEVPEVDEHFFEILDLPSGKHRVEFVVTDPNGGTTMPFFLQVMIRSRERAEPQGYGRQSPVQLLMDPPYATLDALWEQRVNIRMDGPPNWPVSASLKLMGRPGGGVIGEGRKDGLDLPLNLTGGIQLIKDLTAQRTLRACYDQAGAAELWFDAGVLGRTVVNFERSYTPVRWTVHNANARCTVRLVDETDGLRSINVERVEALYPDQAASKVSAEDAERGIEVDAAALIIARCGDETYPIIASGSRWDIFQMRNSRPRVSRHTHDAGSLLRLIRRISDWKSARYAGGLPSYWQHITTRELQCEVLNILCGKHWTMAEARYEMSIEQLPSGSAREFDRFIRYLHNDIPEAIVHDLLASPSRLADLARMPASRRLREFIQCIAKSRLTVTQQISRDGRLQLLCRDALCIAGAPERLYISAEAECLSRLNALLGHRQLICAARALVLALDPEGAGAALNKITPWDWDSI